MPYLGKENNNSLTDKNHVYSEKKNNGKFLWGPEQSRAFSEIIQELKHSTKLYNVVYNDPARPLHVYSRGCYIRTRKRWEDT